ncbi:MAG: flagellar hook-basal body complex protein FliE [Myxococcota bacterium]
MEPIRPLGTQPHATQTLGGSATERAARGPSFGDQMATALEQTERLLNDADRAARGVAEGSADAVEALITLSKAELALRHVVAMSTRALDAYREVMRMQL